MAQTGFDKLISLTDSRYRLSVVVGRRAAQIKSGIPSMLSHAESPKTRNSVTIALTELLLDKGIHWGKDMPKLDDLKKTLELDRKMQAAHANYSVSNR